MNIKTWAIILSCALMTLGFIPVVQAVSVAPQDFTSSTTDEFNDETGLEVEGIPDDSIIVCVGDSITYGSGAGEDEDTNKMGYPYFLDDTIQSQHQNSNITVINSGVAGDTCRDVINRLTTINGYTGTHIILNIGVNDLGATGAGHAGGNTTKFKANFTELVEKLVANNTNASIWLSSMTYFHVDHYTPPASWPKFEEWNAWIETYAEDESLGFLDFNGPDAVDNSTDYNSDTAHPNGGGYLKIAKLVYEALITDTVGTGYYSTNLHCGGGKLYQNFSQNVNPRSMFYPPTSTKGNWTGWTYYGNWGNTESGIYKFGVVAYNSSVGGYVTCEIQGMYNITVWYTRATGGGIVNISINGSVEKQLDTYGSAANKQSTMVSIGGYGTYTVKIEIVDKNASSSGYGFMFEGLNSTCPIPQKNTAISTAYYSGLNYKVKSLNCSIPMAQTEILVHSQLNWFDWTGNTTFARFYLSQSGRQICLTGGDYSEHSQNITFDYIGKNCWVWFSRSANTGWIDIYIDEVLKYSVNESIASGSVFGNVWNSSGITYGKHTVRIEPAGNHSTVGTNYIYIEGISFTTYNYNLEVFNSHVGTWEVVENNETVTWNTGVWGDTVRYRITSYSDPAFDNVTLSISGTSKGIITETTEMIFALFPLLIAIILIGVIVRYGKRFTTW